MKRNFGLETRLLGGVIPQIVALVNVPQEGRSISIPLNYEQLDYFYKRSGNKECRCNILPFILPDSKIIISGKGGCPVHVSECPREILPGAIFSDQDVPLRVHHFINGDLFQCRILGSVALIDTDDGYRTYGKNFILENLWFVL